MAIFKCKMCGGTIEFNPGDTVGICDSCGTKQTLPRLDDDKKANLYDRANHFRRNNDYDKAMGIYEQILNEDSTDAEAYWSLVLCRYGIEYVEDPATHKRVPTVNRAQFTSIFDDDNYKSALKYADLGQKAIYEEEANTINEIQKGILAISQKEEAFDVFICYKETDNNGRRTQDSVLANDLYHQLTQEGFKVFFSRITLEDKLGTAYEPYIFAALNSAKVMVVIGTKPEYFNAVWVKNEWSRYLALIRNGAKKMLIPAYRDMDPYDLPEEFAHLQAQDMSKLGFMQDLIRGIRKIAEEKTPTESKKETVDMSSGNATTDTLLRRVFMFLEDGDWSSADEYCERVLDLDPENAGAYLGKLMSKLRVRKQEQLRDAGRPFDRENAYQKVMRFADESLKTTLTGYLEHIRIRNENERLQELYDEATELYGNADYEAAAVAYDECIGFKDSAIKKARCLQRAEEEQQRDNEIADAIIVALFGSKKRKQIQDLKDEQQKLRELHAHFSEFLSERENLSTQMTELKNKYSELKHIREHLGLFASKEKKAKDTEIAECEAAIETLQTKRETCESKFEGYTSEKEIENRLAQIASEVSAIEAEIPKSTIDLTESEAERQYFASEIIQDIVNKKEPSLKLWVAKTGDIVKFGSYPQSEDADTEKTAIEWEVLAKENERILLISKYGLDCKPYNEKREAVTWETSSIRRWLNEEFMQVAFIGDEQKWIAEITLENPNNRKFRTKGGRKTQDKIFLLSIEEAEKYFASEVARACTPTNYAVANGAYEEEKTGNCSWWLRSPGLFQNNAAFVGNDGGVYVNGRVDYDHLADRPALWVNLEDM